MVDKTANKKFHGISMLILVALFFLCISSAFATPKPRVLVFCKTAGYHHESIADGIVAIQKLGMENKFDVDTTTNAEKFNNENLKQYKAIIFFKYNRRSI